MVMRGCAAACSNRIGSRKIWLMRCGGSGVGQLQSAASVVGEAVAAAGNLDPRQLLPGERGAVADVVRIVGGQPGIADLVGDAEPAENLHGARGDVIAFRLRRRGAGARLHDRHVDAAPGQIDRKREPDRSGADDQHIGIVHSRFGAGFLDDVGPAVDLGLDVSGKTVRRRSRQRLERNRGEAARWSAGSDDSFAICAASASTIGRGVPAGATTPCQATSS